MKENSIEEDIEILEKDMKFVNEMLDTGFWASEEDYKYFKALAHIFSEYKDIKREKELYEYMYDELRKQWERIVDNLLGKDYYNYGCDHYSCDKLTADDLIYKYKKRWWQFWKKI